MVEAHVDDQMFFRSHLRILSSQSCDLEEMSSLAEITSRGIPGPRPIMC